MKKIEGPEIQVLLCQTNDGTTRIEVRMAGEMQNKIALHSGEDA